MIKKIPIFLALFLMLSLSLSSIGYGELEQDSSKMEQGAGKELSELLKNESQFFENQKSGDFHEIFLRKETQEPSNSILVKAGTSVELTGNTDREFSTILVEGRLRIFDTGYSGLRVQKIIIAPGGSLTIGNNQSPIEHDKKAEVILGGNDDGEVGIFVFGKLLIHGKEIESTFVALQEFARKWDKRLIVDSEVNWNRGDEVVITSPGDANCNEISKISKIVNQDIFLQTQLTCSHIGSIDTKNSISSHVALLTRNVVISSDDMDNRGSLNFFHGSYGYIKYAQFDYLGPKEVLGRYPIHFHHLKDSAIGIEVIGNSITNSDNRWVTIHDSNGILVKNNVGYISQGHGFFLEDGTEFDNIFEKNIGIITKPERIRSDGGSSVFWTLNPQNVYRNNVAVNAHYWGFFFAIPNEEVVLPNSAKQVNLRSLPSLEFEGNTAYNNPQGGLLIYRPPFFENNDISSSEIIISDFHALGSKIERERHFGVLVSGVNVTITNSTIMNHKVGIQLSGNENKISNTKIEMQTSLKPNTDISGIVIAGRNNIVENSEISGYISKHNKDASDISVSNNVNHKRLISAKIINTTLKDSQPFHFGNPINDDSFLEIYGYDAPHAKLQGLPENFILKKIGSEPIEKRGEYNSPDFEAMIKMISEDRTENQEKEMQFEDERITIELIKNFKNQAFAWKNDKITDKEMLNEVEILFESRVIEISGVEQGAFNEFQFILPQWTKRLVSFWFDDSISEQEFFNAITYLLESNLQNYS